jgi:hypothetical protein
MLMLASAGFATTQSGSASAAAGDTGTRLNCTIDAASPYKQVASNINAHSYVHCDSTSSRTVVVDQRICKEQFGPDDCYTPSTVMVGVPAGATIQVDNPGAKVCSGTHTYYSKARMAIGGIYGSWGESLHVKIAC